jgi:hypothetical protein
MPKPPNPKVKKYLQDIQVAESDVPDSVMDTLNGLSQSELDAVQKVGDSVKAASGGNPAALSKVH